MKSSKTIYYVGGSPCSGKSTVTKILAEKYGLYYFKVDDLLEEYTQRGKSEHKEICTIQGTYTPEQLWMRDPELQNAEELKFYSEIFEYIQEDLGKVSNNVIITEGAAYLPDLIKALGVDEKHYVCITPTKDFQVSHYKERPWIHFVLEGCSDKGKAFDNWMDRDALFAEAVREQCVANVYKSLITDGSSDGKTLVEAVSRIFGLEG